MKLLAAWTYTVFGIAFGLSCIITHASLPARIASLIWLGSGVILLTVAARKL